MRPGRALLLFTLVVLVGGALLAPALHELVVAGARRWPALEPLARNPFHRFVNRSLLLLALVGAWPLLRALGARSWREVGWTGPRGQGGRLAGGFALGFVSLALVAALALAAGAWSLKSDVTASRLFSKLLSATLSAVVVAVLEETFFRGAILGALRRAHSWPTALLWSSAIYALVHFFQRPASPETVRWYSGLVLLPQMLRGFVDFQALVPGFLTLTLAGLILGLAYQRTGNLYFSIGLHAGWVFWLKFCGAVAMARAEAGGGFWGSMKVLDGWLAFALLAGVLLVMGRWRGHVVAVDKKSEAVG